MTSPTDGSRGAGGLCVGSAAGMTQGKGELSWTLYTASYGSILQIPGGAS